MSRRLAFRLAVAIALASGPALAGGQVHHHGHGADAMREAPTGTPGPSVTLSAVEDMADGYNLHLAVENFVFSPERTGLETEAVEGHAHLYVNGTKIGRVYGPWVHVPDKLLDQGENRVRVSLNDNIHAPWAHGGAPVEAEISLEGRREIQVELNDGDPQVVEIGLDERVRMVIHGTEEGSLHFHGYDIALEAVDGQPVAFAFTAHHSGRFPVMAHVHDAVLGDQERALFYIDIRSR